MKNALISLFFRSASIAEFAVNRAITTRKLTQFAPRLVCRISLIDMQATYAHVLSYYVSLTETRRKRL